MVHTHDDHVVDLIFGRDGQDDATRASLKVLGALSLFGEDSRRLNDIVDLIGSVREVCRVTLRGDGDLPTIHNESVLRRSHAPIEAAVNRVELEEVSEGSRVSEVVNRNDLHPCAILKNTKYIAANSAKAINGNSEDHGENRPRIEISKW